MSENSESTFDKRVASTRRKVLEETYRILTENGFSGASIDAISKGSGVAKTTIYRHWPSRSDLLLDACAKLGNPIETPDTGSLREDLTILLSQLTRGLKAVGWSSILPSIIDAAERDQDVATMFKTLQAKSMAPYRAVFLRAQERGEFNKNIRIADLLSMTIGALFYNRWYSKEPLNEPYVQRVLEVLMKGIDPPAGSRADSVTARVAASA